jgi:hypothetical protein
MDDAFVNNFFGWHTLIFMAVCYILTFFTRRTVETMWPSLQKKADENDPAKTYLTKMARVWNELILFVIPVFFGAVTAMLAKKYPFPEGFQTLSARALFGVVTGFFSGFAFKILMQIIGRRFGVALSGTSGAPPAIGKSSTPPPVGG